MPFHPRWQFTTVSAAAFAVLLGPALVATLSPAVGAASAPAEAANHVRTTEAPDPGPAGPPPNAVPKQGWRVTSTGADTFAVVWRSPKPLPVTDARPVITLDGQLLPLTSTGPDGRTVWASVTADTAPEVADLDVSLSGQPLDGGTAPTAKTTVPYSRPKALTELADDPGTPGSHEVVRSDYRLDPAILPGLSVPYRSRGRVVAPADANADSPLVVFLHGRHDACYDVDDPDAFVFTMQWPCRRGQKPVPSYLGFDYVQELLASQGYVTVSISANVLDAADWTLGGGGALARAQLIEDHLDAWANYVADGAYTADLDNVVLVGHSRGGEGANQASINAPLDAPYTITGQVLIGPTDFGYQASPYVPTVTLLPYCDGDVLDLQGQIFVDAARDLVDDPIAFHSAVLVMGANHNFFNTEWTPGMATSRSSDDWSGKPHQVCGSQTPMRLSAGGQRDVGKAYIAGAVHLFADGDKDVLPMFDGSAVEVPSAGNADVRSHAIGGGLDTRRPGIDAGLADPDGASTRLCIGHAADTARACVPGDTAFRAPHWPPGFFRGIAARAVLEMTWSQPGQSGGLVLDQPWDLSAADSFDVRAIASPGDGPAVVSVRIHDAAGASVVITPEGGGTLDPLPGGGELLGKLWAQTLRVPLDDLGAVDPAAVTQIDLVAESGSGKVWVLDLTARPNTGLADLPHRDVAWISTSDTTVREGDHGVHTVSVPYTVGGRPLTEDASVTVVRFGPGLPPLGTASKLAIPAGTTSGSIRLTYTADAIYDPHDKTFSVVVYPDHGIATNYPYASATITDDDPAPTIRAVRLQGKVAEGRAIRYKVTLSRIASTGIGINGFVIRGAQGHAQMTIGDLDPEYREQRLGGFPGGVPPLKDPLWRHRFQLMLSIPAGKTTGVISVPTSRNSRHDGPRQVVVRFSSANRTSPLRVLTTPQSVTLVDP